MLQNSEDVASAPVSNTLTNNKDIVKENDNDDRETVYESSTASSSEDSDDNEDQFSGQLSPSSSEGLCNRFRKVRKSKRKVVKQRYCKTDTETALVKQLIEKSSELKGTIEASEISKYFGNQAKSDFFQRYHWLAQRIKVTNANSNTKTSELLSFDDEAYFLKDEARMIENDQLLSNSQEEKDCYMTSVPNSAATNSRPPTKPVSKPSSSARNRKLMNAIYKLEEESRDTQYPGKVNMKACRPTTPPVLEVDGEVASLFALADPFGCETLDELQNPNTEASDSQTENKQKYCNKPLDIEILGRPGEERPMTPRSTFIEGCIRGQINPRPIIIRKQEFNNQLILKSQGIGDFKAQLLSDSLCTKLIAVDSLDLQDNNLTDVGMAPIVSSLFNLSSLVELNLSFNVIGVKTSQALGNYLAGCDSEGKHCVGCNGHQLIRLSLANTDLSDMNCQYILQGIIDSKKYSSDGTGSQLKEIDLSNNKLGKSETNRSLTSANQNQEIGSSYLLAYIMEHGCCPLESLLLGWNLIKSKSAYALVRSIGSCRTIHFLDVSYNGIGSDNGVALGEALLRNRSLKKIHLHNNNLDAMATIAICQGVIENQHVGEVVLNGNPIGHQGAKAVMSIPLCVGYRVKVYAKDCNIVMRYPNCWFDYDNVCRPYALRLDDPFDRSVAFALLHIVARHETYIFAKASYSPEVPKGFTNRKVVEVSRNFRHGKNDKMHTTSKTAETIELVQEIAEMKSKYYNPAQRTIIENLQRVIHAADNPDHAMELFLETDEDGSGEVDSQELYHLLIALGMEGVTTDQVDSIIQNFDVDGSPTLTIDQFIQFLKQQSLRSQVRLKDLTLDPYIVLRNEPIRKNNPLNTLSEKDMDEELFYYTRNRYVPPTTGMLYLDISPGLEPKKDARALSACDRVNLFEAALSNVDQVKMVGYAIQGTRLRLEEAQSIYYKLLPELRDKAKVVTMILPYIADTEDTKQFVHFVTDHDHKQFMSLSNKLGNILRPAFGAPDGYYYLNLATELDRACLSRLLELNASISRHRMYGLDGEKSASEKLFRQPGLIGDYSQTGNWSCFRNEFYNNHSITIMTEHFTPMPIRGIIEFDFVSGDRPPANSLPLENTKFLKILNNCCLVTQAQFEKHLNFMQQLKSSCDEQLLKPKGSSGYHARNITEAERVFNAMEYFYRNLHCRSTNYLAGGGAAEIPFDYMDINHSIMALAKQQEAFAIDAHSDSDSEEDEEPQKEKLAATPKVVKSILGNNRRTARQSKLIGVVNTVKKANRNTVVAAAPAEKVTTGTAPTHSVSAATALLMATKCAGTGPTPAPYVFEPDDMDLQKPKQPLNAMPSANRGRRRVAMNIVHNIATGTAYDASNSSMVGSVDKANTEVSVAGKKIEQKLANKRIQYKKLLTHPAVTATAKASRVCDALMESMSKIHITCRQLALVFVVFPQGRIWKTESFGTYRVELLILLYHRIIDIHNLEVVLYHLTPEEIGCVYCRLGWLHTFNPMKPEGHYFINLRHYEDRQFFKMIICLTDVEPGVNFKYSSLKKHMDGDQVPGWELPASWLKSEKSIPTEGVVGFTYYCGEGKFLYGCVPVMPFRRALLQMVLIDERNVVLDKHIGLCTEISSAYQSKAGSRRVSQAENIRKNSRALFKKQESFKFSNDLVIDENEVLPIEDNSFKPIDKDALTIGEVDIKSSRSGDIIEDLWLDYLCVSCSVNYWRRVANGR